MKITIVTGPFMPLPPAGYGAIEVLWSELAAEFAARGHEVTFVSRSWEATPLDETKEGIHFIRRSGFTRSGELKWDLLKDLLYSLRIFFTIPRGDICVTNVFWLPAMLSRARKSVGRIVVNVARAPKGQMGLYRKTARLACTSGAVAKDVIEQTPDVAAITKVLPNPINTRAFIPPALPRKYDGQRVIAYTGRVHPEKGVHLLVEAFAQLHAKDSGLLLRIVGPVASDRGGGGEAYLSQLKTLAGALPVEILPPIGDRYALAKVLQEAHYYCYPSLAEKGESFGVAPLEAMATGLSPVVSDLACFRDFLEEGANGLIFNHRENAIANLVAGLSRLINDPKYAAQMGESAARTALQYSNSAVAELFLADFQGLVDAKSTSSR